MTKQHIPISFLIFKVVEFRLTSGEILYAFSLYISMKQITDLAFHSELLLGILCFIEEKQSGCSQRQSKWMETSFDSTVSQILPSQTCMSTIAASINGAHSRAHFQVKILKRKVSKGILWSFPISFMKLQLLCVI